jgi:2-polyprenyl-3-methyl-5-hydroxy-6-metoxy-1,4-benzoquinol methylase
MLDVGCGAGATSVAIKKQYPQGKFYGVELNPNIATIASEKLDKVVVGNFEDIDYKAHDLKAGSFDTILFADVLEHMYNPWKVLDRTKELLSNGGKVVASIPNISNLQSLDNLARGKWHYDDFGILDFTHIRFFTRETILEMFAETGYEVLDIYGLPLDDQLNPGFHLDVENNLYTHCLSLKNITKRQLNNLRILQFVVTATPKK